MPRKKKLFREVGSSEAFSTNLTEIFENGIPGRPWIYLRIGQTYQALFLPTGTIHTFKPEQEVMTSEIDVIEK